MTEEQAKKAGQLVEEIQKLSKYSKFLKDKEHGHVAHFEFVQHFGNLIDYQRITICHEHNAILVPALEKVIEKLKLELTAL